MTTSLVLCALLCLPVLVVLLLVRSLLHPQSVLSRFVPSSLSSFSRASVSSSSSSPPRVLVVGGSFAGLTFCRELLHRLPAATTVAVTLVEPRQWFEYTPGILRAVVRPSHHPSILTAISDTSAARDTRWRHVQAVCAALTSNAALIVLEGGEERWEPFDYCVLAVGSGYSEHIKQHDTSVTQRAISTAGTSAADSKQQPTNGALLDVPVLAEPCCSAAGAASHALTGTHSSSSPMCPCPSSAPTMPQRLAALSSVHSALQASQEVLIVGAGLVGVVLPQPHIPLSLTSRCRLRATEQ